MSEIRNGVDVDKLKEITNAMKADPVKARNGNNPGNAEISHREWLGVYESSRLIITTRCMQDELKSVY